MEDKLRRQSVYEIIEEHNIEKEKSHKSRSVFEVSQETTSDESDKLESILCKWDEKWSRFNNDDLINAKNIETYCTPEHLKVLNEETGLWLSGIKNMVGKMQEFQEKTEYIETISHCNLPAKHRLTLEKIDAKISNNLMKTGMIINSCEVLAATQDKIKARIDSNVIKSKEMLIQNI